MRKLLWDLREEVGKEREIVIQVMLMFYASYALIE
jgi:hypothetical protein